MWREAHEQINKLKLELNKANNSKVKDLTIRKQNHGLHLLHKELEVRAKELAKSREMIESLQQQLEIQKKLFENQHEGTKQQLSNEMKQLLEQKDKEIEHLKATIEELNKNKVQPVAVTSPVIFTDDDEEIPPPPPPLDEATETIPFAEAKYWIDGPSQRMALSKLLILKDLSFVNLLGKSIPNGQTREHLAEHIVELFEAQDMIVEALEVSIKHEISATKSVNTLFRGEDLPSRLLRVFIRKKGKKFASYLLNDLIKEVSDNNYYFEIDPNRADPSMNLKENFRKLEVLTQRFVDRIFESYDSIPPEFLKLCKCICDNARERFPGSEQLAVAGFFFLRFICPAIASPETFDLVKVENIEARRTLLLVGKILQNLANGVEFKEDYLQDMNSFLSNNEMQLSLFFKKLRTYPPVVDGNSKYVMNIAKSIFPYKDKVFGNLDNQELNMQKWKFNVTVSLKSRVESFNNVLSKSPNLLENNDFIQAFANILMDNEEMVSRLSISAYTDSNQQIRKSIASDLISIFHSSSQIPFLIKQVVQSDISETAYHFLHESFSKCLFSQYTKAFCSDWLSSAINGIIENIVSNNINLEIEGVANKSDKILNLKQLVDVLLHAIISSLSTCPQSLWIFGNTLAINTSCPVFQFFLINYFALAIEDPFEYGIIANKPKDEASRTLQLLSIIIRNIANSSNVLIDDIAMDQTLLNNTIESFNTWAKSYPEFSQNVNVSITKNEVSDAVKRLSTFMGNNMNLLTLIEPIHTVHEIEFGIKELLEILENPPEIVTSNEDKNENIKQNLSQKEIKKLTKEEEKRKKKEEKEKKKELKKKK